MVIRRYTDEEHNFLRKFIPGHTMKEIVAEFNETFNDPIKESQVKCYMHNHKIPNGLKGYFKKGHIPYNKGKHMPTVGRMAETQYKKGNLPHNTKPIGYERVSKDGYVEVKIAMRPSSPGCNDNFRGKHILVWEQHNGKVPAGYIVIFKDCNKRNFDIDNLALVTRAEHLELTRSNLRYTTKEFTETGIAIVKSKIACRKKVKK